MEADCHHFRVSLLLSSSFLQEGSSSVCSHSQWKLHYLLSLTKVVLSRGMKSVEILSYQLKMLVQAPLFVFSKLFVLETVASAQSLSTALNQQPDNKLATPIAYANKTLQKLWCYRVESFWCSLGYQAFLTVLEWTPL